MSLDDRTANILRLHSHIKTFCRTMMSILYYVYTMLCLYQTMSIPYYVYTIKSSISYTSFGFVVKSLVFLINGLRIRIRRIPESDARIIDMRVHDLCL